CLVHRVTATTVEHFESVAGRDGLDSQAASGLIRTTKSRDQTPSLEVSAGLWHNACTWVSQATHGHRRVQALSRSVGGTPASPRSTSDDRAPRRREGRGIA